MRDDSNKTVYFKEDITLPLCQHQQYILKVHPVIQFCHLMPTNEPKNATNLLTLRIKY